LIYKPTNILQPQINEDQFKSSNLNKEENELPLITKTNNENDNGDLEQWKKFILTSLEIINNIGSHNCWQV
jgi:hypothetical protein